MHHINNCLIFLSIAFWITIVEVKSEDNLIKKLVEEYSKHGGRNLIDSNDHVLKVPNGKKGILHLRPVVVVCKGTYDDIEVAIKITSSSGLFDREKDVYEALNATNDENAESHGIPRVYYHGNVMGGTFKAIAMSFFKETVDERYSRMSKPFSDFSILVMFKQAVEILEYFNEKRVVHNDIKPENLFLRGTKVFIADFDLSALNGSQVNGFTPPYASSNKFANLFRYPIDDLESLIFSMWHLSNFTSRVPCGKLLMEHKKKNTAESWVTEQCKCFKFEVVQKLFADICIFELLSGRRVPQYPAIIRLASNAIAEVTQMTEQTEFEWLLKKPSMFTRLLNAARK